MIERDYTAITTRANSVKDCGKARYIHNDMGDECDGCAPSDPFVF